MDAPKITHPGNGRQLHTCMGFRRVPASPDPQPLNPNFPFPSAPFVHLPRLNRPWSNSTGMPPGSSVSAVGRTNAYGTPLTLNATSPAGHGTRGAGQMSDSILARWVSPDEPRAVAAKPLLARSGPPNSSGSGCKRCAKFPKVCLLQPTGQQDSEQSLTSLNVQLISL